MKNVEFFKAPYALSCVLAMFPTLLLASPAIDSIEGELVNGTILTINGRDFSNVEREHSYYDQVDNQPAYETLTDGSSVPLDQGLWTSEAGWGKPIEIVRSGDLRSEHANAAYFGNQKAYLGWPRTMFNSHNDSLYVSWWFKPSSAIDKGGSNKFIRIWDRNDGQGTRISWTQMHMTYSVPELDYSPSPSWNQTQPSPGEWNRFEIYADGESSSIVARLNGKIMHSIDDFRKSSSPYGLTVGLIGFDPSDSAPYADLDFRMKDIYFSESQARVEISDSPIWSFDSTREVLLPLRWSETNIDVELDRFTFESFDGLFVYVVDENGNVNNKGFPLCESCPEAPTQILID